MHAVLAAGASGHLQPVVAVVAVECGSRGAEHEQLEVAISSRESSSSSDTCSSSRSSDWLRRHAVSWRVRRRVMNKPLAACEGSYFAGGEGNLRTPCIVRWPGEVPGRQVSNEIIHVTDWFTTILYATH
jgi:hypothetical protein